MADDWSISTISGGPDRLLYLETAKVRAYFPRDIPVDPQNLADWLSDSCAAADYNKFLIPRGHPYWDHFLALSRELLNRYFAEKGWGDRL